MKGLNKEIILNNAWLKNYYLEIEDSAKRLIAESMPVLSYQLFSEYFKSGNRIDYEKVYFLRREFLVTFSLMSLIDDQKKYVTKLEEVIWEVCDEYTWALPAHIGENEWNQETRFVLDLFACETAATLAEIITLLDGRLSPTVVNRAKQEIFNRVLNPFLNRKEPYSWESYQNNWCAVCGGSIGIATLYLMEDESIIKDVLICLDHYLSSFEEDGVCLEGLSYWTYGMSYYMAFTDLLKRKMGQNGLNDKRLEKIAQFQDKCYFEKGRTISFSDGSRHDQFRVGLSHYLAAQFVDVHIPPIERAMGYHSDHCYRFTPTIRDFYWTLQYPGSEEQDEKVSSHAFTSAEWLVCKSQNGSGMAIKGGHNDEPHNHNDIGTLLYNNQGIDFIIDLGAGEYTRDYFNQNRYTIFCNQSYSHTVPIINGRGQKSGPQYKASRCSFEKEFEMSLEFSDAYDLDELKALNRSIKMDKQSGELYLLDQFEFKTQKNTVVERFVTQILPIVEGSKVIIREGDKVGSLTLENLFIIPTVKVYEHHNHQGELEDVYAIDYRIEARELEMDCYFRMKVKNLGEEHESISE